jgi:hypothetical protein
MTKRYCYVVFQRPVQGLLWALQPDSIVNAYSSAAKAEKRVKGEPNLCVYKLEIR